jgi:hypothetical protein
MALISPELVHDAQVFALEYDSLLKALRLGASVGARRISICFRGVFGWELSPFLDQNVLFEIQEYVGDELDEEAESVGLSPSYVAALKGGKRYFYLEPSLGLGGYVVADDVLVTREE